MVVGVKNKTMNLFKANTTKDYSKPTHFNSVCSGGKKLRKLKTENNLKTI